MMSQQLSAATAAVLMRTQAGSLRHASIYMGTAAVAGVDSAMLVSIMRLSTKWSLTRSSKIMACTERGGEPLAPIVRHVAPIVCLHVDPRGSVCTKKRIDDACICLGRRVHAVVCAAFGWPVQEGFTSGDCLSSR